jgi:hypothetical protein
MEETELEVSTLEIISLLSPPSAPQSPENKKRILLRPFSNTHILTSRWAEKSPGEGELMTRRPCNYLKSNTGTEAQW